MTVDGIILAAGLSKRMVDFKPSIILENGLSILENTINSMYKFCSRIIVVCGYKMDIIRNIVQKYNKVHLVYNKDYQKSMFISIKLGVKFVSSPFFLVMPGDCPFVKETTVESVVKCNKSDIVIPKYNGKPGHPVLINGILKNEIIDYPEKSNLRNFIKEHKHTFIEVNDEGILWDIDIKDDLIKVARKNK